MKALKKIIIAVLLASTTTAKAQKIDSIYVNLYTDSLKKGTYNYINIDGLLSDGHYLPLDSTHLNFSASAGKFYGNSLWIDRDCKEEKIAIQVALKTNPQLNKAFTIYIKKKLDDEQLKTVDELMNNTATPKKKRVKGKK